MIVERGRDMDKRRKRQKAQIRLMYRATNDLQLAMKAAGVSDVELAGRLSKSKAYLSRLFDGSANMTLRQLATMAHEIGAEVDIDIRVNGLSVRNSLRRDGEVGEERQLDLAAQ